MNDIVMDRKEITDYLAKKVFNGELTRDKHYIMLKNKQIYSLDDYGKLVKSYNISPEEAFVYFRFIVHSEDESYSCPIAYLFPLIDLYSIAAITRSYLFKLGFHDHALGIYPATGLKYYAVVVLFSDRLVIELTDIDTMATNTGLRKIVADVLGKGVLTHFDQIQEITVKLRKQDLFAGHNLDMTYNIIDSYYEEHDTSLAKEVLATANAYDRIFKPYRVVYDTTTRQQVLI
jgi:hypothetical protein